MLDCAAKRPNHSTGISVAMWTSLLCSVVHGCPAMTTSTLHIFLLGCPGLYIFALGMK